MEGTHLHTYKQRVWFDIQGEAYIFSTSSFETPHGGTQHLLTTLASTVLIVQVDTHTLPRVVMRSQTFEQRFHKEAIKHMICRDCQAFAWLHVLKIRFCKWTCFSVGDSSNTTQWTKNTQNMLFFVCKNNFLRRYAYAAFGEKAKTHIWVFYRNSPHNGSQAAGR
jgi:hypothetical protein